MINKFSLFSIQLFALLIAIQVSAQPLQLNSANSNYVRLMDVRGNIETGASWLIQPLNYYDITKGQNYHENNPWGERLESKLFVEDDKDKFILRAYDVQQFSSYNSKLPSGINDGALWQGRGYNSNLSTGIWGRYKFVEFSIKPEFIYSSNESFELSPFEVHETLSEYGHPFLRIDKPQRFGNQSISELNLGNSYLKFLAGPVSLGISNQNNWYGPGYENSIILSNNAPGFIHAFIETNKPVKTLIGTFETRLLAGALKDSDYYSVTRSYDDRLLSNIIISYTPSFLSDISIGYSRSYNEYWPEGGPGLSEFGRLITENFYKEELATEDNPEGNDRTDQIVTVMIRWKLSESKSEVYAEYGRGDHSWDYRDFILEPEHARVYTLGALKSMDIGADKILNFQLELTQLEYNVTQRFRKPITPIYTHHFIRQGFTNNGQIIGAGIGPGSNSQSFRSTFFSNWGSIGIQLRRIANDNFTLVGNVLEIATAAGQPWQGIRKFHDVEIHTGITSTLFYRNIEFEFNMYRMLQYNRNYVLDNDQKSFHFELITRLRLNQFISK